MSPLLRLASAALWVVCIWYPGNVAQAQSAAPKALVQARAAIGNAEFAEALLALAQALRGGGAEPEHLHEIYRLQGETLVAVGRADEAKRAFQALLALHPQVTLGEFVSPKIVEVLESARTELGGATLQGEHRLNKASRRLEVSVVSDPGSMAKQVRLSYLRPDATSAQLSIPLEGGEMVFDVPRQASEGLELALLDVHRNVLVRWQVEAIALGTHDDASVSGKTPLWARWWIWAGAGVSVAAVGGVFGVASASAQSELDVVIANPMGHFFSDAQAIESKAKSRATIANFSFGIATALGLAAGYFYWRESQADTTELQVVPVAGPDGSASLTLGGRF